jgi:hypothetical protein
MTVGKAAALTAGFIGAFALGIVAGPALMHRTPERATPPVEATQAAPEKAPAPAASAPRRSAPRVKANLKAPSATAPATVTVALTEPRLQERIRPLLNSGARMNVAAEGFKSAEDFAAVAHAARNTSVPFMVLKHRVVVEGRSLADAIHESKPDIDAKAEAARAERAAKSDVATIAG